MNQSEDINVCKD